MGEPAYWTCKIGPVDRDELPNGADHPLRAAVITAFSELTGSEIDLMSSGWGRIICKEPHLGLATTRELLIELKARGEVSATIGEYPKEMNGVAMGAALLLDNLPGSMLDYKTHGGE